MYRAGLKYFVKINSISIATYSAVGRLVSDIGFINSDTSIR